MPTGVPGSRCGNPDSEQDGGIADGRTTGEQGRRDQRGRSALGTTLARRCAEAGADLVLAARTVERTRGGCREQVTGMGRRALAVGTDITDDAQVDHLVSEAMAAYGKVDVLINNAFRVPSMKPLADTTFQHIRDAVELTVWARCA